MKKIIALFLTVVLAFLCEFASGEGKSHAELYEDGLQALLSGSEEDYASALKYFSQADGYKQAKLYAAYAEAVVSLLADDDTDLDAVYASLYELAQRKTFSEQVSAAGYISIDSLIQYVTARSYEKNGLLEEAIALYVSIDVFDAQERSNAIDGSLKATIHTHIWQTATCEQSAFCVECGETDGNPLGHNWAEATYDTPKVCTSCGITRGEKLVKIDRLSAKVGSVVKFGRYEQDNNMTNGAEGIEWIVLARNGTKALLMTVYGIDARQYDSSDNAVTWENCQLRKWLNEDFMNTAFVPDERALIQKTKVTADANPGYNVNVGSETEDYVYILSAKEASKYFSGTGIKRACQPTAYAVANEAYVNGVTGSCAWWLRTPGRYSNYSCAVTSDKDARINHNGYDIRDRDNCVRPVIWVDLE